MLGKGYFGEVGTENASYSLESVGVVFQTSSRVMPCPAILNGTLPKHNIPSHTMPFHTSLHCTVGINLLHVHTVPLGSTMLGEE